MKTLTLYGRQDCHLCEIMYAELDELLASLDLKPGRDIVVRSVDIDTASEIDPDLREHLSPRVPVLSADREELCHYRLDHESVGEFLSG